jgi:hypothetical protein
MLARVRWLIALALVGGCGFSVPAHEADAPTDTPDAPPDTIVVKWAVDPTSGKAVPANVVEWNEFLKAHGLDNVSAPSGLWLLQESNGALVDSIGTVVLSAYGGPFYQQPVPGWGRKGVGTLDGQPAGFKNETDATLPNVRLSSMTVLALVELPGPAPTFARNVIVAGSSSPAAYIHVDLEPSRRLSESTVGSTGMGMMDPGTAAAGIMLKHDVTNSQQKVITRKETFSMPFVQLGTSRGLFIGGGSSAAPLGHWLYLAAWYGPKAEISDADAAKLMTSLGW